MYAIPGLIFGGGYIAAASTGMAGLVQAGYLVSSVLCISKMIILCAKKLLNANTDGTGSISGLASQLTARRGNILGILGVSSGFLASLLAVGFSPATLVQFGAVAGVGGLLGTA